MKVFVFMGQYWEDGVKVVAANSEAEAIAVLKRGSVSTWTDSATGREISAHNSEWNDDMTATELDGVMATGDPRILW